MTNKRETRTEKNWLKMPEYVAIFQSWLGESEPHWVWEALGKKFKNG